MKKLVICLAILSLFAATAFAANDVRISAIYGAGGNSGAVYNEDFVELFNAGPNPVAIGGWSIQYGSATGSNTTGFGSCTNCICVLPANAVIQPCGYYLVGLSIGTSGGVALPVAIDNGTACGTNLSATTGKVGLVNSSTILNVCPDGASMIDLVGFGTGNCFEGAVGPAPSTTNAIYRAGAGMVDTDNNASDFTASAVVAPRNSASPINQICHDTVPNESQTWGAVKSTYK